QGLGSSWLHRFAACHSCLRRAAARGMAGALNRDLGRAGGRCCERRGAWQWRIFQDADRLLDFLCSDEGKPRESAFAHSDPGSCRSFGWHYLCRTAQTSRPGAASSLRPDHRLSSNWHHNYWYARAINVAYSPQRQGPPATFVRRPEKGCEENVRPRKEAFLVLCTLFCSYGLSNLVAVVCG